MECTFYELNQKAKDEAEKMDALWGAEFFDAEDAEPPTDAPAEENNLQIFHVRQRISWRVCILLLRRRK